LFLLSLPPLSPLNPSFCFHIRRGWWRICAFRHSVFREVVHVKRNNCAHSRCEWFEGGTFRGFLSIRWIFAVIEKHWLTHRRSSAGNIEDKIKGNVGRVKYWSR
jgi:hypothetical protein